METGAVSLLEPDRRFVALRKGPTSVSLIGLASKECSCGGQVGTVPLVETAMSRHNFECCN